MNKILSIGLLALVVLAACTRSVESLKQEWTTENQKLETLKSEASAFAPFITKIQEEQKVKFDAAVAVKDEEQQRKALATAVDGLERGVVKELRSIKKMGENIEADLRYIKTKYTDEEFGFRVSSIVRDAEYAKDKAISEANRLHPSNESEALADLRMVKNLLDGPSRLLSAEVKAHKDRIAAAQKKAAADKKAKDQAAKAQAKKDSVDAYNKSPEAQLVKCDYCGLKNKKTDTKCSGCQAPIE